MATTDFTPGQGGYEAWAAAGKPTGPKPTGNDQWQKDIGSKSVKKAKTTGKSPLDTAMQNVVQKIIKEANDRTTKADKVQTAEESKASIAQAKATNTSPEEAQKQQDKEWAAYVEGLKTAWAKGTLPANLDVPVAGAGSTPNPKDQAANNAPPSDSTAGPAPVVNTTDKVSQLQGQVDTAKSKIAAAQQATGGKKKSFWGDFLSNPLDVVQGAGDLVDVAAQAGRGILEGASRGIDILQRPEYAALGAISALGGTDNRDSMGDVWGNIISGLAGTEKRSFIDLMNEQQGGVVPNPQNPKQMMEVDRQTGQLVPAKPLNPIVAAPTAFAGDILFNPTTYVGLNTVSEAAKGFQAGAAARDAVDVNNSIVKQAVQAGATKATTSVAEKVGKKTIQNITTGKSAIPTVDENGIFHISDAIAKTSGPVSSKVAELEPIARKAYQDAIIGGAKPADALTGVRVAVEQQVMADVAKQRFATLTANALKDNRRILNLKVAGQEFPLGKVPIVDLPYQGARALKAKAAATDVGQGLSKLFSTNYWFPGETHTLWNKANSVGVGAFTQAHQEIQDAFRGLSKADRIRIADATEKGIDLAGEIGTKGLDLGPAQKFFRDTTAKYFGEASKILGKYAASDQVPDYVFHYYRNGSPQKIKDFMATRKARLIDGATGDARFTLQQAEDAGLKPIRQADQILLAHTADHQRQLVRSMWDRSIVDKYGHVLNNPVMAKALGLQEVAPPKLMNMAPGYKLYMNPEIAKVQKGVTDFMGKSDQETAKVWRMFDKGMRAWKMANTTLRPGHHIRNIIGDMFLNHLDGVDNPNRYAQGLKMVSGDRSKVRINVGHKVLNGDDIHKLWVRSGANQGFISSEVSGANNPVLRGLNNFAQNREMTGRYAHFIDVLVKEGRKQNLGANNTAGLYKIATEAGRRINKWNINYSDLTPFEKSTMRRIVPFYTWSRKSMPLMVESLATRPGRMAAVSQVNNLIANAAGVNPNDTSSVPYPEWLKEVGFARLGNQAEPNVWSVPFPPQDLGRMFGGGTPQSVAKEVLSNTNPLIQAVIEQGLGRSIYTGAKLPQSEGQYAASKFGVATNIMDALDSSKPMADRINAITGLGLRNITENAQLGELRRQQDPLQVQISQIGKGLGDYEVHKLANGEYAIYNKALKITEQKGFTSPEDALVAAIAMQKQHGTENKALDEAIAKNKKK